MAETRVAPYGSWKSPITSDMIVAEAVGLMEVVLDGDDVCWIEMRPSEGGRYVVVRRSLDGKTADVTPPEFNARTRVHEYGGGSYAVRDGTLYFSNFGDQRLYRQDPGAAPRPITPEADLRYADGVVDSPRNRLICIREDHTNAGHEAVNTICAVALAGEKEAVVLVSGNDFYSSPRLSPDGSRLAWVTWNHPNMPWDETELWVGEVGADGVLLGTERIAGGPRQSVVQPEWSPDGVLYFVSDRTGWWNLYRWRPSAGSGQAAVEPACEMEAEFAAPQWVFGRPTYAFAGVGQIICTFTQRGAWQLAAIDTASLELRPIDTPYSDISSVRASDTHAFFRAGAPAERASIVRLDLATREVKRLRRSGHITVDPGYISIPEPVEFPTENGLSAHAFLYRPGNRDFTASPAERPPLLVKIHGGPTSATTTTLALEVQYWTSRGFAVVDVNYGGSTGYGRDYRERLRDQWGIVEVDDCVNVARYLAERGEVDGNRLAIRGGSAGGWTTLCALTFRDVFKAGASYFGVSDAEALAKETHKFESRYLDGLIGPYPERKDLYRERSAIHYVDRLSCPLILFQGLEDKIVPPRQAETMFEALKKKGIPVAYVPFEGEQHGFRIAANMKRSLDGELYFYSRVFGFELADPVEPVPIENLD